MKKLLFLFAAILAIVAGPRANAQAHLDFTVPSLNGGTFSWGGNGTPLVGTSIDVTEVAGTDTPLQSGTLLAITGGLMNVTTGAGTFDGTNVNFAGGGAITITGSIPGGSSEALLSGTVSTAKLEPLTGQAVLDVTAFTNSIAADLAGFFGLPTTGWSGAFHVDVTLPGSVTLGQPFTGATSGSGDIITSPVPEPTTMAIAGLGALGMIGYGIRRRKGA